MDKLTADIVKAEVHRFWSAFTNRLSEQLTEFYAPESSVFSSVATRSEPGRLAAARRQREYFQSKAALRAQVGNIDVVMLGDYAAVAAYTFTFHASRAVGVGGHTQEEDIQNGRATQVFAYDGEGKLRIMHEHLSAIEK